jgi:hypothetical protein
MTVMTRIDFLKQNISVLDQHIVKARKNNDWRLANDLIYQVELLEEEVDAINNAVRYQEDLQSISDFYDDEKNRDSYTMMIIDREFSDIAN